MLRGYRWQLAAFIFAAVLFGAALSSRLAPSPTPPTIEENLTLATETVAAATLTPSPSSTPAEVAATSLPQTVEGDLSTYREAVVGEVHRLNPLLRGLNPVEDDITSLIYEGLVRTNEYGEPEPALSSGWVIASNRIEYVFRLREDVLWQDGTPFTAADVAFTMELLRSPDFPGDPDVGAFWRTVETEVLGKHLVRFRLTQPLGSFLDALRIGILPEHALRGTTAAQLVEHPFNLSPVGTGPYQLEAIRTMDGSRISIVDLRPAPVYRQRPEAESGYGFDRIRFQVYTSFDEALNAISSGDADGLASSDRTQRPALIRLPGVNVYTKLEPILGALIFNWERPEEDGPMNPFREQRVRAALANAVNRDSIIQRNLLNLAVQADNPLLPGSWAYAADLTFPESNPEEALFLLETANLPAIETETAVTEATEGEAPTEVPPTPEGETGILLRFSILTPDNPALVNIAQEIANQWAVLPVEVTVEAVSAEMYRQRLENGEFETALVELSLGKSADPDVYSFWHQGQYPEGDNYGAMDDRRISETLERARRDPNGINRIEHYRQFQREFINRAVSIPLYYPLYTYTVSKRVDGVQLGFVGEASDRLRNIREWQPAASS